MAIELITYGTSSWVCPKGVYEVIVECWGAGGNGGNITPAINPSNGYYCSGGGGGGCYSKSLINVTPNTTYPLTFGFSSTGTATATTFGTNLVSAPSGETAIGSVGGKNLTAPHIYNIAGYIGGAGGDGAGSVSSWGDLRRGGGGGGAGSTGNGNSAIQFENWPSKGGAAKGDYGGAGGTGDLTGCISCYGAGQWGSDYGGGGAGAVYQGQPGHRIGGQGAFGLFRLTYEVIIENTSFFVFF